MDNADLETLKLVPGRLNPRFSASTTEYNVLLSSAATQVRVECLTSDSGASYEVKGAGGERTIPLKEGTNFVVIEVSAPDGTIKKYTITVTKLAANLAELSNLNLTPGRLDRVYQKKISEYYATLGWAVNQVTIKPVKQDPKMTVNIDGNPPETPIQLKSMETTVHINVISPDKSNTKVYTIHLLKEDTGYRPDTSQPDLMCWICSSLYQCPRKLLQCGCSFCTVCLSVSQRTDKKCPKCGAPPPIDPPFDEVDSELREKVLAVEVNCFYCSTGVVCSQLLTHAVECPDRLVTCPNSLQDVKHSVLDQTADSTTVCKLCGQKYLTVEEVDHCNMCLQGGKLTDIELTGHKVVLSDWEKKLRVDNNDDFKDLFESGEKWEKEYHKIRNTSTDVAEVKKRLESAAVAYANAIAANAKSSKAHIRLGVVMEELNSVQDLMAKGKENKVDTAANKEARDSSKLEEIDAICKLHGVSATAPLSEKLKALDKEYHAMRAKGDSFKSDRVQELYAWKSKQASAAEKISISAGSDETYLGKAGRKYEDAASLESSSFHCNYLLGWSYLRQLRFKEAVTRFRVCVGAKPLLKHVRYLLGIALSQCGDEHKDEATKYLKQGVVSYQHWISCLKRDGPSGDAVMTAESEFSLYKPQYLMGFVYLADLTSDTKEKRKLLLNAVYLVPRILQTLQRRGDTYLSIEAVLFTAMDKLLSVVEKDEVQTFCKRLSSLLSKSPDSNNKKLLELQVETSKRCLVVETSNGQSLTTLGDALLALHEMTASKTSLREAEQCFRAALEVEGKVITSKSVPEQVKAMQWYKDKTTPKAKSPPPPAGGKTAPARGGAAKRGAAPVRGAPAARGAARGGAAARGGTRGAARGRGAAAGARGARTPHKCEPAKSEVKSKEEEKKPSPEPEQETGPVNEKSISARLGLAKTLGLTGGDNVEERKQLYNEVIELNSGLHDAYIELGELCRGTMQAVDVYCKFPFSEELSFDDAFIFGEMVQILMKLQEFDDPRLERSLIGYGSVMGWNSLENYVKKLEDAFKTVMLRNVYCAVNKKDPEDADVQQYFKFKLW